MLVMAKDLQAHIRHPNRVMARLHQVIKGNIMVVNNHHSSMDMGLQLDIHRSHSTASITRLILLNNNRVIRHNSSMASHRRLTLHKAMGTHHPVNIRLRNNILPKEVMVDKHHSTEELSQCHYQKAMAVVTLHPSMPLSPSRLSAKP